MLHLAKNHTDHHAEGVYIDGRPRAGVGLGAHLGWAVLSSAYSARKPASAQRTADTYVRGLRSDRAAAGARGWGWVGVTSQAMTRQGGGAYHGAGSSCRLQASPKSMSTVAAHVQSCIRETLFQRTRRRQIVGPPARALDPLDVTSTFRDLMSRWMIPQACNRTIARATPDKTPTKFTDRTTFAIRSTYLACSMTKQMRPASRNEP